MNRILWASSLLVVLFTVASAQEEHLPLRLTLSGPGDAKGVYELNQRGEVDVTLERRIGPLLDTQTTRTLATDAELASLGKILSGLDLTHVPARVSSPQADTTSFRLELGLQTASLVGALDGSSARIAIEGEFGSYGSWGSLLEPVFEGLMGDEGLMPSATRTPPRPTGEPVRVAWQLWVVNETLALERGLRDPERPHDVFYLMATWAIPRFNDDLSPKLRDFLRFGESSLSADEIKTLTASVMSRSPATWPGVQNNVYLAGDRIEYMLRSANGEQVVSRGVVVAPVRKAISMGSGDEYQTSDAFFLTARARSFDMFVTSNPDPGGERVRVLRILAPGAQ